MNHSPCGRMERLSVKLYLRPKIITVQNKDVQIVCIKFRLSAVVRSSYRKGGNFRVTQHFQRCWEQQQYFWNCLNPKSTWAIPCGWTIVVILWVCRVFQIVQHRLCGYHQNKQAHNVEQNEWKEVTEGWGHWASWTFGVCRQAHSRESHDSDLRLWWSAVWKSRLGKQV